MKIYRINQEISSPFIRISGNKDLLSIEEALNIALTEDLDLIEISSQSAKDYNISICVLQDYKKFLYQQKKIEKEVKKNQVKTITKELRFSYNIDEHDFLVKLNHARDFIKAKNRVRACVFFKGREIVFKDKGEILLLKLAENLSDIAKVESMPKLEGKRLYITLIFK